MSPASPDREDELVRAVAIQNAQSILIARQRAEDELVAAKEALEARTLELERANELVRTIADNATSCLLMIDERGIATYMNPAAIEETGYTLDELSRFPFHDLLHSGPQSGGHAADACPIRRAREAMLPLRKYRDLFVRKDGTVFPVACSLSPLQREGYSAGAVLEFRDITDEQLAQKALEEASRRKDEFLATLSHELRTPMTAVLGWARMLKLGLSESDARQAIDAIEKSANIQAQLIDDVLDVSRIVAGKMTFRPMPVDVAPVLHAAMTTVHPAAAAKGIEILSSVPPQLPRVLGDEGRLQQIFWNLLSNAVKFTPAGGSITVRIGVTSTFLRLAVQDTGKGIEPDYLSHVFEAFSQEDSTTTRAHEGIGLGLSIVRSLVELHGGHVRVASEGTGRGTTFTVELPVMDAHAITSQRPEPPREISTVIPQLTLLSGVQVLVIDDQAFTRDLISAIFRRAGASVNEAESVADGLKVFAARMPDIVMCDLAMPHEDGFSFVRSVRALPTAAQSVPVIALTAFGRREDRELAQNAGFNAFLTKPVDPQELTAIVADLLRRRG